MKVVLIIISTFLSSICFAQNSSEYNNLKRTGDSLYKIKDYINAATAFSATVRAAGNTADIWDFDRAAFSWALTGNADSAFAYLGKISNLDTISFWDYLDVIDDRDFNSIRTDIRWQALNSRLFKTALRTYHSRICAQTKKDAVDLRLSAASAWAYNNQADSAFTQLDWILKSDSLTSAIADAVIKNGELTILHNDIRWQELLNRMAVKLNLKLYNALLTELDKNGIDVKVNAADRLKFAGSLTSKPDSAFAHLNDAATELLKHKNYNDAFKIIEASDKLFPNNYWIQQDFGNYYVAVRDGSKAFHHYSKALCLKYFVPSIRSSIKDRDSAINADYRQLLKKFGRPSANKRVLIDEGHHNFHTSWRSYAALANLLRENGFNVSSNIEKLTRGVLQKTDVLLIASAASDNIDSLYRKAQVANEPLQFSPIVTKNAFSDAEVTAIKHWVNAGGSLFFIIDHAPHPKTAESLASAFSIETRNVGTYDSVQKNLQMRGRILFTKQEKLLGSHPILKDVDSVMTYTGSSMKGPLNAQPLLILPSTAIDQDIDLVTKKTRIHSAAGRIQGLALEFGKGRLVMIAEAGMFTTRPGTGQYSIGSEAIARSDLGNRKFAINIVKWLSKTR